MVWRTLRSGSELRWLQLVEDAVFGALWDSVTQLHDKAGVLPVDALNQCAFLEDWSSIRAPRTIEQRELARVTATCPNELGQCHYC
ncbi:MAG: hypothetical protein ACKPKO_02655, partial [Candidatus Fonsibacter sp.]